MGGGRAEDATNSKTGQIAGRGKSKDYISLSLGHKTQFGLIPHYGRSFTGYMHVEITPMFLFLLLEDWVVAIGDEETTWQGAWGTLGFEPCKVAGRVSWAKAERAKTQA